MHQPSPSAVLATISVAVLAGHAWSQLTPDRLYYGIDRAIPMSIAVPAGVVGESTIRLYTAPDLAPKQGAGTIAASAPAAPGPVNLAALFPMIWAPTNPRVRYAQLLVGQSEVGPPVVIQPMISPKTASLINGTTRQAFWFDDATKKPSFDPKEGAIVYSSESPIVFSGVRAYTDVRVVFATSEGDMEFAMRPDAAPNTVWNFLQLVRGGFYTDIAFHRVVPLDRQGNPFVVQVGDPTGTGDGGPGFSYDLEPTTLLHDFGVISVARDTDPNTNGSQVFVCLSREGTARLDGRYTAFGQLVRGTNAVKAVAATPLTEGTDKPVKPPVLFSAKVIPAPAMERRTLDRADAANPATSAR